jgi:tripartite-type tricarboxylate transporter receptor subunit TctC
MDQALDLGQRAKIDLRTLNWIGEMSDSSEILVTSKKSKIKSLQDSKEQVTMLAVTGYGSAIGILIPLYNNYLGTKFKLIYGYPSGPDMTLAMTRGEVDGRGISSPQELAPTATAALEKYNFLIQAGVAKLPGFENVPLFRDLARNDEQRRMFEFVSDAMVIARPVVTNAGVSADRVAALRRAFDLAMNDPGLVADAKRQGLQISVRSGVELEKLVSNILDAPPDFREKVARAVQFDPAGGDRNEKPAK